MRMERNYLFVVAQFMALKTCDASHYYELRITSNWLIRNVLRISPKPHRGAACWRL